MRLIALCIYVAIFPITSFAAEELIKEDVEQSCALANIIFTVIGGVVTFIPTALVARYKIRQAKAEILDKRLGLIGKLKDSEESLIDAYALARSEMNSFMGAWEQKEYEEVSKCRDNLSRVIDENIIHHLKYTAEYSVHRWTDEPDRQLSFIRNEVRDTIEMLERWMTKIVNHPDVMEKLSKEPLILKRSSLQRLNDIALECHKSVKGEASTYMKQYIDRLVEL